MTPQERVIARAENEIGYLEKATNAQLDDKTANAGKGNYTKYARDLDNLGDVYNGKKNGYDWCDVFVDWCFIMEFGEETGMALLCQAYKGLGAGTKYSRQYYANKGQLFDDPQPGDQCFFGDNSSIWHTGIVTGVKNGRVYTIEGNTSGASGVVSNGGGVAAKSYPVGYIYFKGFGRPDWSLVEEDDDMDISKLTDEQILELWNRTMTVVGKQPGSAWSQSDRDWAVGKGLFKGGDDLDGDGNPDFKWKVPPTREELAAVLHRNEG